jgi:hypothetical protein
MNKPSPSVAETEIAPLSKSSFTPSSSLSYPLLRHHHHHDLRRCLQVLTRRREVFINGKYLQVKKTQVASPNPKNTYDIMPINKGVYQPHDLTSANRVNMMYNTNVRCTSNAYAKGTGVTLIRSHAPCTDPNSAICVCTATI